LAQHAPGETQDRLASLRGENWNRRTPTNMKRYEYLPLKSDVPYLVL
jgi:hypothetical protein